MPPLTYLSTIVHAHVWVLAKHLLSDWWTGKLVCMSECGHAMDTMAHVGHQ